MPPPFASLAAHAATVSRLLGEGEAGSKAVDSKTGLFDPAPLQGSAMVAASLPPYFSGDALRFQSLSDLRAALQHFRTVGAVLAVCDEVPPPRPLDLRVMVGTKEARTKLRCVLRPAQPGTAVLQVEDKASIASVFEELDPAEPAPSADARVQGRHLVLPMRGKLWNPTTPGDILRLPVHRLVTDIDLQRPSVPLLLRWLRTTKGVLRVELSADGQPIHNFVCVDGREVRSPVSLQTLARALAGADYSYEVVELPRAPQLTSTCRTLHLIAETVRALLARHEPEAIAAAFPSTKDTRLVRAVSSVVDALGFQGAQARIIKSSLQGHDTVESVTRSGARVAWEVLVVLDLFGGLTYVAGDARRATPQSQQGIAGPRSDATAMVDKDHFAVLGLHWSTSPAEVPAAYQRMRSEYLPGGAKRPASAAEADKILRRLDDAFKVLNDGEARRTYRRATYKMVWAQQAQMLVTQAQLALYRMDLNEARNLLLAAQDIYSTQAASEMLAILNSK